MTDFHSLSRSFQKKMARTKEKVLMTFGKADRTTDDDFEVLSKSFNYQQVTANKLVKHFKNYTQQVKAMSAASRSMHMAMCEAYESSWEGSEKFAATTEELNALWDDHFVQVSDFLNFQIASYACKFPELKVKIEKRGRKLLDYDRTRHKVDNMERSKKRDEAKLNESIRELDAAQTIYEGINNELFEELPVLFDNRMPLLAKFFTSFLKVEFTFEEESSKLKKKLNEINSVLPCDPAKLSQKTKLHTLRAKTLPRREPNRLYSAARYSPQTGRSKGGKQEQADDRRKTMPARPVSPPFPSRFLNQHHPPAPLEPAPLPPSHSGTIATSSSSTSCTSSSRTETTKGYGDQEVIMRAGDIRGLSNTHASSTGSSNSSSHPTKPPQPRLAYTPHKPSPPKFGRLNSQQNNSGDFHTTPTSALPARWGDEKYANTRDIINYIPQLTSPASTAAAATTPGISTSPVIDSKVSLSTDSKARDIAGFIDITKAPLEVGEDDEIYPVKSKQIIENIYTNVAASTTAAADVATKSEEAAQNATDVLVKIGESTVETGEKSVTTLVESAVDVKKEMNGDVVLECASPGTVTTSTTIQVSDAVDEAKKLFNGESPVKTPASPFNDKDIVVTNEVISSILLPTSSYLFKVQATNNYKAADADELSLEAGDVVYVLPIEDIDLEDEGWALGLRQKDGVKGMFPVNFTRKIV